ncbi:MAG: hypothetical protein J6J43_05790 [Oscillospiraceae bacterium]|nr:hypothetical protein [Oscillospiraceae bacterium]
MKPDKVAEYIWQEMLADAYAELERFSNTEGPARWSEYVRGEMEQAETKNTAEGGVRFARDAGENDVDQYDADVGYKEYEVGPVIYDIRHHSAERRKDLLKIGTMPRLYRRLFSLKGNVYVSSSHLYQNIVSKEEAIADGRWVEGADYHALGEPKVIEAILQSQDPMVLMESLKDYESPRLVAIVEEKGKDGLPLIVVTELYAKRTAFGEQQDRNHVLITVYEKTGLPDYVKNTLEKGRILHIKEGLSADTQASLQLAGGISEEVLKQNVAQFNKKIKAFKEKNKINYSAAGESALTADEASLQAAKDMLDMGESMESIRQKTGWYQGRDGKWRFDSGELQWAGNAEQYEQQTLETEETAEYTGVNETNTGGTAYETYRQGESAESRIRIGGRWRNGERTGSENRKNLDGISYLNLNKRARGRIRRTVLKTLASDKFFAEQLIGDRGSDKLAETLYKRIVLDGEVLTEVESVFPGIHEAILNAAAMAQYDIEERTGKASWTEERLERLYNTYGKDGDAAYAVRMTPGEFVVF